jgi:aryl-alcohol dehydrogenase-like predicted oxidoreductase
MPFCKPLPPISRYTLGTANIRDKANREHIRVARAAMDAGIWFHSAAEYAEGAVFDVLAAAFREDPRHIPQCIFKIKSFSPEAFRASIEEAIARTGVPRVDIAQICWYMPDIDKDLRPGCALHDAMCDMLRQGKVGNYVLEFFRPSKPNMLRIVGEELFDAYIYYHNVVNREVSNEMYDLLARKSSPVLALRTVGGGAGDLGFSPQEEGEATRAKLADLVRRSGAADEMDLRMRFPLSYPRNLTTIGATTSVAHLNAFLELGRNPRPLPPDILGEIDALHRRWFAT